MFFRAAFLVALAFLSYDSASAEEEAPPSGVWQVFVQDAALKDGRTASLALAFQGAPIDYTVITAVGAEEMTWLNAEGQEAKAVSDRTSVRLRLVELRGTDSASAAARWDLSPATKLAAPSHRRDVSVFVRGAFETPWHAAPVGPEAKATVIPLSVEHRAALARASASKVGLRVRTFFRRTVRAVDLLTVFGSAAGQVGGSGRRLAVPLLMARVSNEDPHFVLGAGASAEERRERARPLFVPAQSTMMVGAELGAHVVLSAEGYRALHRHLLAGALQSVPAAQRKRVNVITVALPAGRFATVHVPTYGKGTRAGQPARERQLARAAAGAQAAHFCAPELGIGIGWEPPSDPDEPYEDRPPSKPEVGAMLRLIDDALGRWRGAEATEAYDVTRVDEIAAVLMAGNAPPEFETQQLEYWIDTYFNDSGKPSEDMRWEAGR